MAAHPRAHEVCIMAALRNLQAQKILNYRTFSDEWVVKFWRDDETAARFIFGYFNLDLNSQAAAAIAFDKVATYELLKDAGIPAVEHVLLTSPDRPEPEDTQLATLLAVHGPLVIKPTQGSSGREIARCDSIEAIKAHIHAGSFPSWCASPLLSLTSELRVVVLGDKVLLAYEKRNPVTVDGVPMFNLAHGAVASPVELDVLMPDITTIAIRSLQATGLRLAAVDIVTDQTGKRSVIEINSRFSLEHFADMAPANRESVIKTYETILETALV